MPTIATRGGASARGFGFSGIKTNVTSQTFTSSTTWVAPAGVTSLLAVIGKGQDGVSDYQGGIAVANVSVSNDSGTGGTNSLPITAAAAYNTANACANTYNVGGYQSAFFSRDRAFIFYSNQTFSWVDTYPYGNTGDFPYYLVGGTWSLSGSPLSGSFSYPTSGFSYAAVGDIIYPGGAGANTTGFGYTFTGGGISGSYPNQVGSPASPASYTNVAVTPGASYALSISGDGYITIQYLS